ncbi:MAG TPA: BrnT family toxin [Terriglobia bacterium]
MDFEWSEDKRIAVLEARGLDFIDAAILFDGRTLYTVASPRPAEERWLSVGEINGRLVAVVWTRRSEIIRIITMRRARDGEKERYRALFG